MPTNPFEDDTRTYLVLTNPQSQFSLWPDGLPVPAGWTVTLPASTRAACLAHVEAHWTDIRPATTAGDA
jgi:MbtH protein